MGKKKKKTTDDSHAASTNIPTQQALVEKLNTAIQKSLSAGSARLSFVKHLLDKI
jgi:hypothetical protein